MQHKQHTERQGDRRGFYLFSPSSPGISRPWPQAPCAPCSGQRGLSGTGGLQCWNHAQVRLSWVSGMVFYRAVWLGPIYSLWRTAASGAPPSWPGLVSSSVVFMLPVFVFGGSSYDLPACLGDGSQAVQFLVKEDKTKQTEERATCHRELRQCLVTVWISPAE